MGGGEGGSYSRDKCHAKEALAPNRQQIIPVPLYIGTYSVVLTYWIHFSVYTSWNLIQLTITLCKLSKILPMCKSWV